MSKIHAVKVIDFVWTEDWIACVRNMASCKANLQHIVDYVNHDISCTNERKKIKTTFVNSADVKRKIIEVVQDVNTENESGHGLPVIKKQKWGMHVTLRAVPIRD